MTDLEITRRCAVAMGYSVISYQPRVHQVLVSPPSKPQSLPSSFIYNPLHDDEQAMALVKKFEILLFKPDKCWQAVLAEQWNRGGPGMCVALPDAICGDHENLNRAICETVAKMQDLK